MFAREGYPIIAAALLLSLLLFGVGWWIGTTLAVIAGAVPALGLTAFTLFFFRDPERTPPPGAEDLLLAPADGRVVEIVRREEEPLYLKAPATRVSIFLSPLNVHVNRAPAAGTIEFEDYKPGDYLVAWHPKASAKNERSELGLRHDGPGGTKVLFKQIAGAVARRIVYHLEEGDRVKAGERFGLVRFGSRMDVIVPPSVAISVEEGEHVRGGESVLGRLSEEAAATNGAADGNASAGKASAGKASAGKASAGKASAGKASAGKASAGKASAGKAAAEDGAPARETLS